MLIHFLKLIFFENPTFFSLIHLILKLLKIETSEVLIDRARERFSSRSWAVPVSWVGFPGNLNISVVMTFNVSLLRLYELVLISFIGDITLDCVVLHVKCCSLMWSNQKSDVAF